MMRYEGQENECPWCGTIGITPFAPTRILFCGLCGGSIESRTNEKSYYLGEPDPELVKEIIANREQYVIVMEK
jgi:hypothetical protein